MRSKALLAVLVLAGACDKPEAAPPSTPASTEASTEASTASTPSVPPLAAPVPEGGAAEASAPDAQAADIGSGLEPAQLKATMAAASEKVKACFNRGGKGPPTSGGAIFLRVEIDPGGHVGSARVADAPPTTINDAQLTNCLIAVVRRLQFPQGRDGKSTVVPALPFRLNLEQ
jgi:hypothetical protein